MSYSRNVFFIVNDLTGTFYKSLLTSNRHILQIIVNFSQKKIVANLLILFLFYAIFRLADFSSDPFGFRLQKRDKEEAPSLY